MLGRVFLCALIVFAMPALAVDRSYPVADGMILHLGNCAQRVQDRAKSFGPGVCGVKFTLEGKEAGNFLAPPLQWSPWTPIGTAYLGTSTTSLGFDAICDTSALAEVKYGI